MNSAHHLLDWNIPPDWQTVEVGEVAIQITDGDHHTPVRSESGVALLSARNVLNGSLSLEDVDYVAENEYQRMIRRCHPEPNDILVSCSGSIGRVCVVPDHFRFGLVRSVALVKLDHTSCDPEFIAAAFRSEWIQRQILASQLQAAQPNLFQGAIKKLRVQLPPLPQQQKIARILTTLDNLIEKAERLIAKYQAIKQGMMHDLFTRGVDAHGHLRPPQTEAPDLYKQSELGWIPDSWTVRPLGEVAEVGGGVTLGRDLVGNQVVKLPYLRVANVQDGYLDLSEIKTVPVLKSEVERYSLQTGDMVMTEGGDFDKLGRGTVWRGQISLCLHQNHIFRVRPSRDCILPDFLASITASSHGKRYFLVSSKQTTNLATINSTQLKAFPVPVPNLDEQSRIVARLAAIERQIDTEQRQLTQRRQLKTGLMQDLLTGKVRVKVDEA